MRSLALMLLAMLFSSFTYAYDCSQHTPFVPVSFQDVSLYVGHFSWQQTENGKEEVVEDVCSSTSALKIPVLDIRGREEEWFYCNGDTPQPILECTSTFQGQPTSIQVKPAIVIRSWQKSGARDTHFHAYIIPNNDPTKYFDLFARRLSPEPESKPQVLDAAGGGRGENSGIDSFYIRADFK
jgi:hypothetical protein